MHLPQVRDDCPPSSRCSLLPGELPKLRDSDGPEIGKMIVTQMNAGFQDIFQLKI
jgi:hypothetical protein